MFGGKVVSESTSAQCDRRERKPPAACSLLSSNSGLIEPLSALSVSVFVFKLKERQRETFIEISADRESIGILRKSNNIDIWRNSVLNVRDDWNISKVEAQTV